MALVIETIKYRHKTKGHICNVLKITPFKIENNLSYRYVVYQILKTKDMANLLFGNQWHLKEREEFLKEHEKIEMEEE